MTNTEIFLQPGQVSLDFLLSLAGWHPSALDPSLYMLIAGMMALVIWSWAARLCFEIVKKAFGFGSGRGRYG